MCIRDRHVGRLEPPAAVALLLGAGNSVDQVVRLPRARHVLLGEVLPHEPTGDPGALAAQGRELGELVVLVAEDRRDGVVRGPALVLRQGDFEGGRLGDPVLVPDVVAVERSGARTATTSGTSPGLPR